VATAKFIDHKDYEIRLNRCSTDFAKVAEKAIRAGMAVAAPVMRRKLQGILSPEATGQLVGALGITPVKQGTDMSYNAHLGFDGYQQPPYGRFPQGVPFQLIARSFESGAGDWRPATPFAKPALQEAKEEMQKAMEEAAEKEFENIMKGKM
jgi:hypothetical protein